MEIPTRLLRSGPFDEVPTPPTQLRWDPFPLPEAETPTDFIDGLITLGGNGDPSLQSGIALHMYAANASMTDRFFYDADGELLIVPQLGSMRVFTELGMLDVSPGHICVVPRGLRFRVELLDPAVRGLVARTTAPHSDCRSLARSAPTDWRTREISGVRSPRSRIGRAPSARTRSSSAGSGPPRSITRRSTSWRGTATTRRTSTTSRTSWRLSTVTFDPPDPSIYTVLTAPTAIPGTANADFAVFPPRWIVSEHTFRLPSFHRNVSSEFLTLIRGAYHGKGGGFAPGGASLHNCMTGHGPDAASYEKGLAADDKPEFLANTLAVLVETQLVIRPTKFALESQILQRDYLESWQSLKKNFTPGSARRPGAHERTYSRSFPSGFTSHTSSPESSVRSMASRVEARAPSTSKASDCGRRTGRPGRSSSTCIRRPRCSCCRCRARWWSAASHVLCAGSRYARNDSPLVMEKVLLDLGAYLRHAKDVWGYERIVIAGWSGGGSLSLFYQSQAEKPTITQTPAGDPVDIPGARLIPADAMLLQAAHVSRAVMLRDWIDPSVRNEDNPDDRDPELDLYDPRNPNQPPYSPNSSSGFGRAARPHPPPHGLGQGDAGPAAPARAATRRSAGSSRTGRWPIRDFSMRRSSRTTGRSGAAISAIRKR